MAVFPMVKGVPSGVALDPTLTAYTSSGGSFSIPVTVGKSYIFVCGTNSGSPLSYSFCDINTASVSGGDIELLGRYRDGTNTQAPASYYYVSNVTAQTFTGTVANDCCIDVFQLD